MFADNLVPHVTACSASPTSSSGGSSGRADRARTPEEVEIRARALHAVELIVDARAGVTAAGVDQLLWCRGQQPRYKAFPRHLSRCTAY